MNTRSTFIALLGCVLAATSHAGPRTSANYSISTDTADAGGQRGTSASYTNDGSAGLAAGISTVNSPAETVKSGYVAQLYEIVALQVNSASLTNSVNETATLQLAAWQLLDDGSFLGVAAPSAAWSVVSGPVTGISTTGLATAGAVYQDSAATVQAVFGGQAGQLNLTVLDTIKDNFGSYAADGIGDDWQVQYFGQPPNANADPNVDADGTGQTNLFKYVAGLNPVDPNSRFSITVTAVPGQPGQKAVSFSPVVAGRTYTVTAKTDLATVGGWRAINGSAPSDNGNVRTITDLSATDLVKFYQVEITSP